MRIEVIGYGWDTVKKAAKSCGCLSMSVQTCITFFNFPTIQDGEAFIKLMEELGMKEGQKVNTKRPYVRAEVRVANTFIMSI